MGTTIVAMFAVEDGVYVAHVGDSRVYRIRDGKIEQLTEDHSLLNDYIKMKRLTPEEIANFPHKNVIVRALGMKDTVKVDTRFEQPRANDIVPALLRRPLAARSTDPEMLEIVHERTGPEDGRVEADRARQRERRPRQHHVRAGSLARVAVSYPSAENAMVAIEIGPMSVHALDCGLADS